MDNVTHGLIGLLAAEAALVARYGARSLGPPGLRAAAVLGSVAANSTPDLDFVYTAVTGGKLGYLLHHRGHTHTLAGALPMALLVLVPLLVWARKKHPEWSRGDRWLVALLCLVGPLLHLGMDGLNNYGVHPFWPVRNGWVYGDAVFIVEPLFFVIIGVTLSFECRTRGARWLLWSFVLVILGLSWTLPFVTWAWALGLTLAAALLAWGARRSSRSLRVWGASMLVLGVIGGFLGASRLMENRVAAALARRAPAATTHDTVLTPMPANPLCWSVLAVQTEGADYVVRRGRGALLPGWVSIGDCPRRPDTGTTAPLVGVSLGDFTTLHGGSGDGGVAFEDEFRAPLAELRALAAQHCGVAAFLRFARAPFFVRDGASVLVGDLRYDREPGEGFTEMEFPVPPASCPRAIPPWRPPLADLL